MSSPSLPSGSSQHTERKSMPILLPEPVRCSSRSFCRRLALLSGLKVLLRSKRPGLSHVRDSQKELWQPGPEINFLLTHTRKKVGPTSTNNTRSPNSIIFLQGDSTLNLLFLT